MTPQLRWVDGYADLIGHALHVIRRNAGFCSMWCANGSHWQLICTDYATEEEAQVAAETHLRGVLLAAMRELDPEFARLLDKATEASRRHRRNELPMMDTMCKDADVGACVREWSTP